MTVVSTSQDQAGIGRRSVIEQISGVPAMDGDGVRMTRVIGSPALNHLDPFLLLDVFESDDPRDYIGGFPPHPHRGFETITYMFAGRMRHRDSTGHEGVIEPGGVQWMTAAKGIVHSEMPEQEDGLLSGIQLWLNLPAALKMTEPAYQEFPRADIPIEALPGGGRLRVIAGTTGNGTIGPARQPATLPLLFHASLDTDQRVSELIPSTHNVFVFVHTGGIAIEGDEGISTVAARSLAVLGEGSEVQLRGLEDGTEVILGAALKLNEPIARGGPFVMNTRVEILQAFQDFSGRL